MNSLSTLTGSHQRTYQSIFQHPLSHNLAWHDVHALFRHLGEVAEEPNGNLKVTCNTQTLVLHPARTKDVEPDHIVSLRHFLEKSETKSPTSPESESHWLLVIDHHQARIFRSEMAGALPERIVPHHSEEFPPAARDSKAFSRGQEKPSPNTFFPPVAKALQGAGQILVFGTGTGKSSEMVQFVAWLKLHHADIAKRIIGALVVDEHHLTEGELLAKARGFYTALGTPVVAA